MRLILRTQKRTKRLGVLCGGALVSRCAVVRFCRRPTAALLVGGRLALRINQTLLRFNSLCQFFLIGHKLIKARLLLAGHIAFFRSDRIVKRPRIMHGL